MSVKLSTCEFLRTTVTYLGHVLESGKLVLEDFANKSLKEALPPCNKQELGSFLGACRVYRRIVQNFAHATSPLSDMLQKRSPKTFANHSDEQLGFFQKLIKSLISAPIFHLSQLHHLFTIDTDVSDRQLGCVLFQTNDKNIRCPNEL